MKITKDSYVIGSSYRYLEIPEESNDKYDRNEYGPDYIGQCAIHIRIHKTETDIWFIYDRQANTGIFKCVYKI